MSGVRSGAAVCRGCLATTWCCVLHGQGQLSSCRSTASSTFGHTSCRAALGKFPAALCTTWGPRAQGSRRRGCVTHTDMR